MATTRDGYQSCQSPTASDVEDADVSSIVSLSVSFLPLPDPAIPLLSTSTTTTTSPQRTTDGYTPSTESLLNGKVPQEPPCSPSSPSQQPHEVSTPTPPLTNHFRHFDSLADVADPPFTATTASSESGPFKDSIEFDDEDTSHVPNTLQTDAATSTSTATPAAQHRASKSALSSEYTTAVNQKDTSSLTCSPVKSMNVLIHAPPAPTTSKNTLSSTSVLSHEEHSNNVELIANGSCSTVTSGSGFQYINATQRDSPTLRNDTAARTHSTDAESTQLISTDTLPPSANTTTTASVPTAAVPSTVPTAAVPSTVPTAAVPSTVPTAAVPSTVPTAAAPSTVPTSVNKLNESSNTSVSPSLNPQHISNRYRTSNNNDLSPSGPVVSHLPPALFAYTPSASAPHSDRLAATPPLTYTAVCEPSNTNNYSYSYHQLPQRQQPQNRAKKGTGTQSMTTAAAAAASAPEAQQHHTDASSGPPSAIGIAAQETNANSEQLHPLQSTWCLWILVDRQSTEVLWRDKIKAAHEFSTVEGFWCMHHNIHKPSAFAFGDYYLFRKGIMPDWNDDVFANGGGRYIVQLPFKFKNLDSIWLHGILLLIGEGYDDTAESQNCVCGIVAASRSKLTKLALWIATDDVGKVFDIGQRFVNFVQLMSSESKPSDVKLDIRPEFESFKKGTSLDYLFRGNSEKSVISWPELIRSLREYRSSIY